MPTTTSSVRLAELTRIRVQWDKRHDPTFVVINLADPVLYRCPMLFMEDVGTADFTEKEAQNLREFFLKGGFLWVDDFWGSAAWEHWRRTIARVLPPAEFPIFDIPHSHPIMRSLYDVKDVPQIPSINCWMRECAGETSERGYDSAVVHFRGIQDSRRPADGADVAQHRHRRHLGARGREPGVLRSLLAARLRPRRERRDLRDDPLRR